MCLYLQKSFTISIKSYLLVYGLSLPTTEESTIWAWIPPSVLRVLFECLRVPKTLHIHSIFAALEVLLADKWSEFSITRNIFFLAAALDLLIVIWSSVCRGFFLQSILLPYVIDKNNLQKDWKLIARFNIASIFMFNF